METCIGSPLLRCLEIAKAGGCPIVAARSTSSRWCGFVRPLRLSKLDRRESDSAQVIRSVSEGEIVSAGDSTFTLAHASGYLRGDSLHVGRKGHRTERTTMQRSICFLVGFSLAVSTAVTAQAQQTENAKPFGISKRIPWTTSRMLGSPEPPVPYLVEREFPNLQF